MNIVDATTTTEIDFNESVCLFVCLSVCHTFFTMSLSSYHHELLLMTEVMSMQKVKVKGQGHRGHNPT